MGLRLRNAAQATASTGRPELGFVQDREDVGVSGSDEFKGQFTLKIQERVIVEVVK